MWQRIRHDDSLMSFHHRGGSSYETGFAYSVVGKTICYIDGNHHVYQRLRVPWWWFTQSTMRKGNPLQVDENRGAQFFAMISFFFANQHANTPWRNMEDISTQIQVFVQHQVATSRKLYGTIDDGRISVRDAYGSDGYTPDLSYTDRSTWRIWTLKTNVVTISRNNTYKKRELNRQGTRALRSYNQDTTYDADGASDSTSRIVYQTTS